MLLPARASSVGSGRSVPDASSRRSASVRLESAKTRSRRGLVTKIARHERGQLPRSVRQNSIDRFALRVQL